MKSLFRRPAVAVRRRSCAVESLESRRLFSSATLRVVTYNIEDDIGGYTAPRPGLATVLEGIGAESVGGVAKPIDVLALNETTSNAESVQPIVDSLNAYYGAGTYATSAFQATESGGNPTTGNGPNAIVYNDKTLKLLASVGLSGTLGSTSGVYRQIVRYEFEAVGGTGASDFYVYVDHYKSGTGSTNASKRQGEAQAVRADEAALPAAARVIYAGDFNTSADNEGIFTTLMASGQGQALDPLNPAGGPDDIDSALSTLTESSTDLRYRDDYQMITDNVESDASGLEYVAGTYHAFGNNGSVPADGSVDSSSNTALAGLPNRSAVLSALTTASDHLPVVADYAVPLASTTGPAKLTGAAIGTAGSYQNHGNTKEKALDGDLTTYFTAPNPSGDSVGLDFGAAKNVTQIKFAPQSGYASRMVGGVFQVSNAADFSAGVVNLYTVSSAPAQGTLTTVNVSNANGYRYARYLAPSGSYDSVAEVQFFGTAAAAPTQLAGTTIGTAGSYQNHGNTIAKATDGDLSTYFTGPTANGDWVGIDLGSAKSVKGFSFAPESGYASRMVGGIFQASTTADFSGNVVNLYTITAAPAQGVLTTVTISPSAAYRYYRYLSPNGSYGSVAEVAFLG